MSGTLMAQLPHPRTVNHTIEWTRNVAPATPARTPITTIPGGNQP